MLRQHHSGQQQKQQEVPGVQVMSDVFEKFHLDKRVYKSARR